MPTVTVWNQIYVSQEFLEDIAIDVEKYLLETADQSGRRWFTQRMGIPGLEITESQAKLAGEVALKYDPDLGLDVPADRNVGDNRITILRTYHVKITWEELTPKEHEALIQAVMSSERMAGIILPEGEIERILEQVLEEPLVDL